MEHESKQQQGQLGACIDTWTKITQDKTILMAICGYELEFKSIPPLQTVIPRPYKLQEQEKEAVTIEIQRLCEKGVLEKAFFEKGQFISNIFTRPKKNGGFRMILDLSQLNEHLQYHHFKMDTLQTALTLVTKNCFMSSIDLRDAYYHVPIAQVHRKYLRFIWQNELYQFCALPNGLTSGPRIFTKILKPPFAKIRALGHCIMGYIDDSILVAKSRKEAQEATKLATEMLTDLGFDINTEKSVFEPTQELEFLGFILNSQEMTVKLPLHKKDEIKSLCISLLSEPRPSIRFVAQVIGKLVAAMPGVQYGPMYYRQLEKEKTVALKLNRGHFDRKMTISNESRVDLQWWIENIDQAYNVIGCNSPDIVIDSDASGQGWGATDQCTQIGGRWNTEELNRAADNAINYLEMQAAYLAIKSFCKQMQNVHVRMRIDNTTAVSYISNMGGIKSEMCNQMAKKIWQFCIRRNIWLSVEHLPGVQNVVADFNSRHFQDQTEWQLNTAVFTQLCDQLGNPELDLFASRLNAQLPKYISWKPDPEATSVDAFKANWNQWYFYAFPPFCLIGRCLQKIDHDEAQGILIVPKWPTQSWFPRLLQMLVDDPIVLPQIPNLLTQPASGEFHPLIMNNHLSLLACRLSGKPTSPQEYRREQLTYVSTHGENLPKDNIIVTYRNGFNFVTDGRLIQCKQLLL